MAGRDEAKKLGLTDLEYDEILNILGREPNFLELALYSVMWSEHCSYKNSKRVLKTLPTEGPSASALSTCSWSCAKSSRAPECSST